MGAIDRRFRMHNAGCRRIVFCFSICGWCVTIEFFDGCAETDIVHLADEADHVAAGIAAKAVVKVGLGIDGKGWGLLLVEGTEADVVAALLLELDSVSLDDGPKVMDFFNLLDLLLAHPHFGPL